MRSSRAFSEVLRLSTSAAASTEVWSTHRRARGAGSLPYGRVLRVGLFVGTHSRPYDIEIKVLRLELLEALAESVYFIRVGWVGRYPANAFAEFLQHLFIELTHEAFLFDVIYLFRLLSHF